MPAHFRCATIRLQAGDDPNETSCSRPRRGNHSTPSHLALALALALVPLQLQLHLQRQPPTTTNLPHAAHPSFVGLPDRVDGPHLALLLPLDSADGGIPTMSQSRRDRVLCP